MTMIPHAHPPTNRRSAAAQAIDSLIRKLVPAVPAALLFLSAPDVAASDVAFTIKQNGPDVVVTGQGSLDLSTLTGPTTVTASAQLRPNPALITVRGATVSQADAYSPISGPSFGTGTALTVAASGTGSLLGIDLANNRVLMSAGYVSGTTISGSAVFPNQTLQSLGITLGTYEWNAGGNIITLQVLGPPEIEVADVTDGTPGIALTDGQTAAVEFGCTKPGVPVTRTFEIRNAAAAAGDLVIDADGLSLPAGFSRTWAWPTAEITPEFNVVALKTSASASTVDSLFFELVRMPSQLSVDSVSIRIPDRLIPPNPVSQTPYVDETKPIVLKSSSSGVALDSTGFGGRSWILGSAARWQQATLNFVRGTLTGSLEDPTQNDDVTFGFGLTGLNPPALPPGTQNDGDGFGQAGIEVVVVLYNSMTGTTETVTGVFEDDGIDNDISSVTFTAGTVTVPVPVTIPPGQTWESVVGTPFTVRLDALSEGYYSGQWSLANDDPNENPFNFPITGIVDGTPPVISGVPTDIEAVVSGDVCSAVVTWTEPTATDNFQAYTGLPTLVQTAPINPVTGMVELVSGSTFPVGMHVIQYTATDCAGNRSTVEFLVDVLDTDPPSLVGCLPKRIIASLPVGASSVAVTFPPLSAFDNCDPDPQVICTPESGSLFSLGATTVTCVARDSSGNESPPETFIVVVIQVQEKGQERTAEIVIERNVPAPGVSGATVSTVSHAYLNENGSVAIEGTMLGAGTNNLAVWKDVGGGLELVSRKGDTVAGFGPIARYDNLVLNDAGGMAFRAFAGTPAAHLYSPNPPAPPAVSVKAGDTPPATLAEFKILHEPALDGQGATLSPANLLLGTGGVTIANDTGIWRKPAGGPLAEVAREGSPVGAAMPGVNFGQVAARVVANESGQVAIYAFLEVGSGGVTLADNAAILSGLPGALTLVSREGDVAPGPDPALFQTYAAESINNAGRVAFEGELKTGGGTPVTSANNTGIYTNSNGVVELVAREGAPVNPCGSGPGGVFSSFREIFLADNGDVFFHAYLTGTGVNSGNDGGFWRWSAADSALFPVLREGDVAPGTNGVFASLIDFAVSDGGLQIVTGTLVPGVGDTLLSDNYGLWLDNGSSGIPILRAREGDAFNLAEAGAAALTFLSIDKTTNAAGGAGGHGKVLNDSGEIITKASFNNNTSGAVMLTEPPAGP